MEEGIVQWRIEGCHSVDFQNRVQDSSKFLFTRVFKKFQGCYGDFGLLFNNVFTMCSKILQGARGVFTSFFTVGQGCLFVQGLFCMLLMWCLFITSLKGVRWLFQVCFPRYVCSFLSTVGLNVFPQFSVFCSDLFFKCFQSCLRYFVTLSKIVLEEFSFLSHDCSNVLRWTFWNVLGASFSFSRMHQNLIRDVVEVVHKKFPCVFEVLFQRLQRCCPNCCHCFVNVCPDFVHGLVECDFHWFRWTWFQCFFYIFSQFVQCCFFCFSMTNSSYGFQWVFQSFVSLYFKC